LSVCLKCYLGSCANPGPGHNHAETHFEGSQHAIFLNIKLTPKAAMADGQMPAQKITKLAIGMPGGIDADTNKFDTSASVCCRLCQAELPLENPQVASMVDSVLLAQSAYNQGAVAEWSLDLRPCEHTLTLDQSAVTGAIDSKALAHCSKCDLKSNLWLCMTCGSLGCGRRYYDGTGGNGHGAEHSNETGHSVALKLGTITPEGSASIYCYSCDEDVQDENLAEHLHTLGIDIASQKKTEKSVAELNLEANLNLTLSKVLEAGKTLEPVFGPGLTGMENLGNSCYMNSVVQMLFNLPEFRDFYVSTALTHLSTCGKRAPDCSQCQISKLAVGLQSGEYSTKKVAQKIIVEGEEAKDKDDEFYQDGIRPAIFKSLMGKGHSEFSTGQQQDARQYLQHLLEKFMLNEKQQKTGQDPTDAFSFELEQRLQCTQCHCVKYNRIKDQQLLVTIPVASNAEAGTQVGLDACLEATFADSVIEDFACAVCNAKTMVTDRKRFIKFPRNLVICLKRIVFDDWVPKKLEIDLAADPEAVLDLSRFGGGTCELRAGEFGFPESQEPDMVEPDLDADMINMLIQNGIPELAAKHAIFNTGGTSADEAAMWFYGNIDNPVCQTPLLVPNPKKSAVGGDSAQGGFVADPESLMLLTSMGFSDSQAKRALRKCDGNLERAADWVMSHMDEPDSEEGESMQVDQQVSAVSRFADD